jgi:hypothetical protein
MQVEFSITTVNTGKTPALEVGLVEINVGDSETHVVKTLHRSERTVVGPNSNAVFFAATNPVPREGILAFQTGKTHLYVRCRIEYRDIFGNGIHPTYFCAYYPTTKPPFFFNCSGGNFMN